MPAPDAPKEAAGFSRPPTSPSPRRARPIDRAFVSSTWLDLQPERRALMEAIAITAVEDVIAVFPHQIVAVDLIVLIEGEHVLVDQRIEMLRHQS